jgi:hypothetical protein
LRANVATTPKLKLAAPSRQGLKQLQQGAKHFASDLFLLPSNLPILLLSKVTNHFETRLCPSRAPNIIITPSPRPSSIPAQSSAFPQLKESASTRRETLVLPASSYWSFCCSSPKLASASTSQGIPPSLRILRRLIYIHITIHRYHNHNYESSTARRHHPQLLPGCYT